MWPRICRKCVCSRSFTGGPHDAPPDPLVGWGGDTHPRTTPHSAPRPSRLRRLSLPPPPYTTDSCTAAIRNDLYMKPSIHIPTTCSAVLPRRMPAARCSSAESARSPPILPSGLTLIHNVHGKKSDPRMEGEKGPH